MNKIKAMYKGPAIVVAPPDKEPVKASIITELWLDVSRLLASEFTYSRKSAEYTIIQLGAVGVTVDIEELIDAAMKIPGARANPHGWMELPNNNKAQKIMSDLATSTSDPKEFSKKSGKLILSWALGGEI